MGLFVVAWAGWQRPTYYCLEVAALPTVESTIPRAILSLLGRLLLLSSLTAFQYFALPPRHVSQEVRPQSELVGPPEVGLNGC
jgi:hypothetical protein